MRPRGPFKATLGQAMTPREQFKATLEQAQAIDLEQVVAAVERLPADVRAALARGPITRRYSCGVCSAVGADFYRGPDVDLADARWIVWLYHEVPKVSMTHRDQLHYGELANEIYRRCLDTYRAAGWTGEAPEPDA